jgi:formylglycine-generating enzyme required for sulfatase activity
VRTLNEHPEIPEDHAYLAIPKTQARSPVIPIKFSQARFIMLTRYALVLLIAAAAAGSFVWPEHARAASPNVEIKEPGDYFWNTLKDSTKATDYDLYLFAYPQGRFAPEAKRRIQKLRDAQTQADKLKSERGTKAKAAAKAEADRVAKAEARAERAAKAKAAARAESDRLAAAKVADKAEADGMAAAEEFAKAETERLAKAEAMRIGKAKAAKAEAMRVAQTKAAAEAEAMRVAKAEAAAKAKAIRIAKAKAADEAEAKRMAEAERFANAEAAKARAKRVAKAKAAAKAEAKRIAKAKAAAKAEAKRIAKAKAAAKAEAKRIAKAKATAKAEAKRIAKAKATAKAEAKRIAKAKATAKVEAERIAKAKATAKAEAKRVAKAKAATTTSGNRGVTTTPSKVQTFRDCDVCPEMISLAPGRFKMGADSGDQTERPAHLVQIDYVFAMSRFEVTLSQWTSCHEEGGCDYVPKRKGLTAQSPAINLSWLDAQQYVKWLSKKTSKTYRLPSEAEWEYAARAGTQSAFWWGKTIGLGRANCKKCGGDWNKKIPAAVDSFAANPFGLHGTSGGVWEWVADCWADSHAGAPANGSARKTKNCSSRTLRGGSWRNDSSYAHSSSRLSYDHDVRYIVNGLRVVRGE